MNAELAKQTDAAVAAVMKEGSASSGTLDDLLVRVTKLEEQMKKLLPTPTTTALDPLDFSKVLPSSGGARRRRTFRKKSRNLRKK